LKKNISLNRFIGFFLISFLLFFQNVSGEVEFSGFFDTYGSIGFDSSSGPQVLRSDLKTNLEFFFKKGSIFFSTKFIRYSIIDQSFELQLKEAYLSFSLSENVEVRAGRQIFSWGNSERIIVSDIISPMDLREYITMDYYEMKMGIDSFLLSLFRKNVKFDLIWSPFFRRSESPYPGSIWFNEIDINYFENFKDHFFIKKPNSGLKNSQIFAKLSLFLKGFDISVYGFSKWNDIPFYYTSSPDDYFNVDRGFEKLRGFGFYFSKPIDFIMLRGEFIIYKNRLLRMSWLPEKLMSGDYKKWMAGIDIFLRNELKITFQLLYNTIPGRMEIPFYGEKKFIENINISGKIGDLLRFRNYVYLFLNNKNMYNRTELIFRIDDSFKVMVGVDIFKGLYSYFGKYLNNSQIWLKLKYIF